MTLSLTNFFYAGLLVLFITFLLGLIIYLIRQLIIGKDRQIDYLTNQIEIMRTEFNDVRAELENLKERKRQTGPTLAGIEDIQAALTRIKFDRQYQDELLDASLNTLSQIRKGPYAYDPNTHCVTRKEN